MANLSKAFKTLRNYVRFVLPFYLKVDKDNKSVFGYSEILNLTA